MGERECVRCDYSTLYFQRKSYLNHPNIQDSISFSGFQYLIFAAKSEVPNILKQFCSKCERFQVNYRNDEIIDERYVCGETKLLFSFKDIEKFTEKQQEELQLRLDGNLEWGNPTKPAGIFSSWILRRYFARDWYSNVNKPHTVFYFDKVEGLGLNKIKTLCSNNSISSVKHNSQTTKSCFSTIYNTVYQDKERIKKQYVQTLISRSVNKGYNDGVAEAVRVENQRGYDEGMADYTIKKERAYKNGFKQGYDAGYKEGFDLKAQEEKNKHENTQNNNNNNQHDKNTDKTNTQSTTAN